MNNSRKLWLLALIMPFSGAGASTVDAPDALATALRSAIDSKDIDAASRLVQWEQAPDMAHRLFKMSIADCFAPPHCKIEVIGVGEEGSEPSQDYFFRTAPEGRLKITPPDRNGSLKLPFARVDGQYRIIVGQWTPAGYTRAKSDTNARKIAEAIEPDLLASGTALAADGGEPFRAYREYLTAVARGDTNYLATSGTAHNRYAFGQAYKSNPVKAGIALELARMESIAQPTLLGGFVKDGRALLLVGGTSGQGWTTEGAVVLELASGKWLVENAVYSSFPPRMPE